ncbi:hypothetical protein CMUST_15890 (plasmid) [Corynebacterium mustelae]|uniref:Uncharacterized protein n=1 Tax=Corynebacterium mustelae TaxID=571915 RepID=A0A0G3H074_9CORY|nr:hypothetical protein [Corynebacterium mustelae]AKK05208.1 hypothetical protein CMUST_04330 [Corynebacterium mustelae]AKK07466.1 hypothetical protein CMUST_15890 [Corynebacterium mustelae]
MNDYLIHQLVCDLPEYIRDAAKSNGYTLAETNSPPRWDEAQQQQDLLITIASRNIQARDQLIRNLGHALDAANRERLNEQSRAQGLKEKVNNQKDSLSKIIEERKTLQIEIKNLGRKLTVWHQRQAKAQKALYELRGKHPEVDYTDLADALSLTLEEQGEVGE